MKKYFLTVDWCNKGKRGVFCSVEGNSFAQDEPFTEDRIWEILDCFSLVLSPQSIELDEVELSEFNKWYPLAEFSNQYGIAVKSQ